MKPAASLEWIDLTLPVTPAMSVYPGDPPVAFLSHRCLATDGYRVSALRLGTHAGTHLDAPAHFLVEGATVEQLPLAALLGPARVVDVRQPAAGGIAAAALGRVKRGERLLLRTDWGDHFGRSDYYEAFPSLEASAVEALARGPIALLGLETPSLCVDSVADRAAHERLLRAGVVIVEGLTGVARLSERVWLVALPLRLTGLDGSPCRVVAAGR